MRFRIGILLLVAVGLVLFLWLATAKQSNHKMVADPNARQIATVDLTHDPGFVFRYGDGGEVGYKVFTLDAKGHCTYLFATQGTSGRCWRQANFDCDTESLNELRQLLLDLKVTELPKEFHDLGVSDGEQRFINVSVTGYRKTVYWDNWFPTSSERIKTFVETRFIKPREWALTQAPTTEPAQAEFSVGG